MEPGNSTFRVSWLPFATVTRAYAVARTIYAATKSPVAGPHLATAAGALGKRYTRKPKATAAAAQPTANAASAPAARTQPPSPSTTALPRLLPSASFHSVPATRVTVAKGSHEILNPGFRGFMHLTLSLDV